MSRKSQINNIVQYELSQKNNKIETLSKEKTKYIKLMHNMQSELYSLKSKLVNNNKLEKELKTYQDKNIELENEVSKLTKQILDIHRKYNDEKRKHENNYNEEIKNLKCENEKYKLKIEMVNELAREKNGLLKAFDKILQERNQILMEHDKMIREKEINNDIKISNLKKKMIDSINETQIKLNELNVDYIDSSSKLTYLQNNQLLLKIEFLTQSINDLTSKNQILQKKIYELNKDIQIHKKVEKTFAEKNKKLIHENKKLKDKKTIGLEKKYRTKTELLYCKSSINLGFNSLETNTNEQNRIIKLEQKVLNLEKKLLNKQKEYNEIKDKNDYIEKALNNYGKKYSGIFNFFEESLKMFINDNELNKNKDLYINLESMKIGDFSKLNNEEKYSALIILMKYLMPLIHNTEAINNINSLNDVNLKLYFKNNNKIKKNQNNKELFENNNFVNLFTTFKEKKYSNKNKFNSGSNLKYNSFDVFPNVEHKIPLLKMARLSPKKEAIKTKSSFKLKI